MRQRRFFALIVAAATVTFAACGSSGGSESQAGSATVDGNVVAVGAAPMPGDGGGSIGDAIEVAAAAPGQAGDAACTVDRQTLELATQSYEILNGALPTSQQDLLDAQMILELSVRFEVSADGTVVPTPGSPCT